VVDEAWASVAVEVVDDLAGMSQGGSSGFHIIPDADEPKAWSLSACDRTMWLMNVGAVWVGCD
jgi:hypothetical protein